MNPVNTRSTCRRARVVAFVIAATIALGSVMAGPVAAAEKARLDFSLQTPEGKTVTLKQLLEKGPVLVTFWATFCKPCKKELPHLEEIYKEFGPQGFSVVAISTDQARDVAKVKPYIDSNRFTFTVLLDTNGETQRRFQASYMPTLFILDRNGNKVYSKIGYNPGDEKTLHAKVAEVIGSGAEEKAPGSGTTGSETQGG